MSDSEAKLPYLPKRDSRWLDAGENGRSRCEYRMDSQMISVAQAKCRVYLPTDWQPNLKVREIKQDKFGTRNVMARFAGPREREWLTVRYMAVNDDDGGFGLVKADFIISGIMLKPHPSKSADIRNARRYAWGEACGDDSEYVAFHHAEEEMDARTGTFEVENRLYRIFSVAISSQCDCWRFEYAFPATWLAETGIDVSGGVTAALLAGNGRNGIPRYKSFLLGLDPESATPAAEQFRTTLTMGDDGMPVVSCEPRRDSDLIAYTVLGKESLDSAQWVEVTDANRASMRFFKVQVDVQ